MVQRQSIMKVPVIWRGKKLVLQINSDALLKELGEELQTLTDVKADTIRLIIPQPSTKGSSLLMPFSDEHSNLRLQEIGIVEGKSLRMMGVSENEIDNVRKDAKANLRIAGFEEEEKRMKQLISRGSYASLKLPQGPYIFCDFRTLELPGVKLNPPPSEALKRMHMLAADPGIVAIMNKHRWRVGIMTEMAPVGYVGVSPKCILGFNKNQGEEISLRLRTDDLKGFRKYESIKKTLLHELAHMVFSEHDANFYALDKQLNNEAFDLDWTKSRGHTLADTRSFGHDDMDLDLDSDSSLPHKLGGESSLMSAGARLASVAAAYHRLADSSTISEVSSAHEVQNSEIYKGETDRISSLDDLSKKESMFSWNQRDGYSNHDEREPDPDDCESRRTSIVELKTEIFEGSSMESPNHDGIQMGSAVPQIVSVRKFDGPNFHEEPDPDDIEVTASSVDSSYMQIENNDYRTVMTTSEPDPDDSEARHNIGNIITSMQNSDNFRDQSKLNKVHMKSDLVDCSDQSQRNKVYVEPDPDDVQENNVGKVQPDSDCKAENLPPILDVMADEPDPDDELRRIQDSANLFFNRLNKAIELLHTELNPSEAMKVVQTLFKLIRNASENPNEIKYKRLRKGNPVFQRNIAKYPAAMDILSLVGFSEEVITGELGNAESYLVLKRNDPGLLWLAKSSLESTVAEC